MKRARKEMSVVINDRDVIYEQLDSLIKETKTAVPQLIAEDYYKILLFTGRFRETTNILRELKIEEAILH